MPGLDDFYRGDVGREIAADLERIGSPVTRDDLDAYHATVAEPLQVTAAARHALQHAAADPGPRLADDPRAVRAAARRRGGKLRSRPRAGRSDQARACACATASSPIPTHLPHALDRYPRRALPRRRGDEDRPPQGRALAGAPGEGDTVWMGAADASGLVVSYIQSLYWEFGSGCVLPRTGVLMQNRGASFSLDRGALNPLDAGPAAVPHAQSGARRAQGRPRHGLRHHGRRRPAADAGRAVHAPCASSRQPLGEAIDRPRWLLGRTWGSPHTNLRHGIALRRQPDRPADVGRPRRRRSAGALFRHDGPRRRRGAASATARWKAPTIRAPTAAPPGCDAAGRHCLLIAYARASFRPLLRMDDEASAATVRHARTIFRCHHFLRGPDLLAA